MFRLPVLAVVVTTGLAAQAAAADEPSRDAIAAMTQRIVTLEDKCRGGAATPEETEDACNARDGLLKRVNEAGWCYGRRGEHGYQHE